MRTLIFGGAASGKSEIAEAFAIERGGPRIYIAAMEPFGEDAAAKIKRHHLLRAEKGFATIERYVDLASLMLPENGAVLLECLTNLTANEIFSPNGAGADAEQAILRGIEALSAQTGHLTVVTGDLFADGRRFDESTEAYLTCLAGVNRVLAARFDRVIEVVCGIPLLVKGGAA
jgi:adenosylcobinamide kinase/adenosylcobinamide-phosphate guanylyltransferase